MKPIAGLALCLTLTTTALAQTPFTDPANLRGERPAPRTGRELPIDQGALGLQQLLRKLNTRASILNIVAHPDDEDGGMLTLYSRGLGARVADLSLTRGEGGQNAMTGDFEDALGLLRTQELLANDRYTGVDQMFGTEVDFGFSKTKQEAFAKWTHERVLYDAVRAIRLYRPLVITSTWTGNVTDGHGQHQASGQIAQEAFRAAADPKVFPDMIAEGILPWQALRVYARVPQGAITAQGLYDYATNQYTPAKFTNYVTGEVTATVPSADVIVHEGAPDPLLTLAAANPADLPPLTTNHQSLTTSFSYVQFARIGLSLQKSQIGPGFREAPSGAFDVPYHLYGSALCSATNPQKTCHPERSKGPASPPASALTPTALEPSFFDGIDTSILSLQDIAPGAFPTDLIYDISRAISASTKLLDPAHPDKIAPLLAEALQDDDTLIKSVEGWNGDPLQKANALHELRIKRVQLNDALALSLGLSFRVEARTGAPNEANLVSVVPGSPVAWDWHIDNRGDTPVTLLGWNTVVTDHFDNRITARRLGKQWDYAFEMQFDNDPVYALTAPYFHRPDVQQPYYDLSLPAFRNSPGKQSFFQPIAFLRYRGADLTISTIPAPAIAMSPVISVSVASKAAVLSSSQKSFSLTVHVQSGSSATMKGSLRLELPAAWESKPQSAPLIFKKAGATSELNFTVTPGELTTESTSTITAVATVEGKEYREGFRAIGYPGLPTTNYYTPATTRIVPVDLQIPTHHNIAYLPGTGDAVPEALTSINLTPTILTVADLTPDHLKQYDAVILGVRTYSAHPDLHGAPTQALLDYAHNGGNVVVQYQTPEFTAADAPYPLSLGSNEKVVDETAPVQLLLSPKDLTPLTCTEPACLLTTPNRITPADFNNWIEERGHGFLSTWDPHYAALTETHDPGQSEQRGGLITTPLGKGRWTYCAFALYRQLPEAVPGAYRLFLNLLDPRETAPK
jgi:LmbE family N-acetylglucosaminyl deacetylase